MGWNRQASERQRELLCGTPAVPAGPRTHVPPDPLVDRLHEEGGEETTEVHHQRDGGDELLSGGAGASRGPLRLALLPRPTPPRPAPLTLGRLRE